MSHFTRRIAHLDMDAFYASVELLRYPELQGKSVVIGGSKDHHPTLNPHGEREFSILRQYIGRGVITTATYAARSLGVHSGMGLMKAAQLAPDAILLPVDFDAYRHYSRLFKAAVKKIAPQVEDRGIDEIYIDLTDLPQDSVELAQQLKDAVKQATGLCCSIAIAPNKLLAKMGSDLDKPDGLTILRLEDIERRIWPLSVSKIHGIGPKSAHKLLALGVHTIRDLVELELAFLHKHFGKNYGNWLYQASRGQDERPVVTYSEPKSISRETTFERDLHVLQDRLSLSGHLTALCQQLADDLKKKGYRSRTIGIKIKFDDFSVVTRDMTLEKSMIKPEDICYAARECLKRVSLSKKIRLLGVRASTLVTCEEAEKESLSYKQGVLPCMQE